MVYNIYIMAEDAMIQSDDEIDVGLRSDNTTV